MRSTLSFSSLCALASLLASPILAQYPKSPKRGLVSVSTNNPQDNPLFVQPNNGLTWYYNYGITPTPDYKNISQSTLEFVPMLWGLTNTTGSTFLHNITSMIDSGRNITHVLSFNEPDVNFTASGSQISPNAAAASWILNFDPLRKMGVKVGAPCVFANETGFVWLEKFYNACRARNSNCTADFMNLHVFGNISVVESYLDTYRQKYPGIPLWVTEFGLSYSPILATETFFNQSIAFFDNDTSIERYSYFGAFRGSASNVGWNASMLDGGGHLTNIGSWYLGGAAVPVKATIAGTANNNTGSGKKSSAVVLRRSAGEMVGSVVIAVVTGFGLMAL